MKYRFLKISVLLLLVPVLALSSCLNAAAPQSTSSPQEQIPSPSEPTPSPSLTASPASVVPSSPAPGLSPAPTEWHSGVKTDYSGLTPYKPLAEKYTRLSKDALPDLMPSGTYGTLMPYIGETMYGEYGLTINLYGLVTESGMIVTDPVYTRVYRGSIYNYGDSNGTNVRAYDLEKIPGDIDKNNPRDSVRHAVCALDGSWITKFDYQYIYFTEKAVLCVRNNTNLDIDMLDYNGKLLYNTKSLPCWKDIPQQPNNYFLCDSDEGLISIPLPSGKTMFVDVQTGAATTIDYAEAGAFSDGLARVTVNGLVGFIDRSFKLVINPQFLNAEFFSNGKSIAQLQDGSYAVIDRSGNILLKNRYAINRWDPATFCVLDADNNIRLYDASLKEISTCGNSLTPLYNGWYYDVTGNDAVLMNGTEKYTLIGVTRIGQVSGGLVSYYVNGTDTWSAGIKTLDGKDVVPLTKDINADIAINQITGDTYIIVSRFYTDGPEPSFTVMTKDGKTIMSGQGYASYNDRFNLFEVNEALSYGYADINGNYIFRISLMKYVPD